MSPEKEYPVDVEEACSTFTSPLLISQYEEPVTGVTEVAKPVATWLNNEVFFVTTPAIASLKDVRAVDDTVTLKLYLSLHVPSAIWYGMK